MYCSKNKQWRLVAIYGPMIYTSPHVMLWCGQIHYEGKWEWVRPWKSRLFWALLNGIEPLAECHLKPKKSRFPGPKEASLSTFTPLIHCIFNYVPDFLPFIMFRNVIPQSPQLRSWHFYLVYFAWMRFTSFRSSVPAISIMFYFFRNVIPQCPQLCSCHFYHFAFSQGSNPVYTVLGTYMWQPSCMAETLFPT